MATCINRGRHRGGRAIRVSRGFTLIELLIAVAIFGMVVGLATLSYSLYSKQWTGWRGGFDRTEARLQRLDLVTTALEDAIPWVVRDQTGQLGFYFLGRDEGLTLVTGSPVFTPHAMAVVRVFREATEAGTWNLVYEEAPLTIVRLLYAAQNLPFSHRMVVAYDIPEPVFRYYGWESLLARNQGDTAPGVVGGQGPQWYPEYDGIQRRQHPERIAIELGQMHAVFFVPSRADSSLLKYVPPE